MSEDDIRQIAADYFQKAYALQMQGEYQQAIEFYTRSIETFATAEAYTFRGWTYSFLGDYDRAIAECLQAIKVDPDFGNPYNDIGAYLIEQEKWDEAIPWFQKAIAALSYEARPYPHFISATWRHWQACEDCEQHLIENVLAAGTGSLHVICSERASSACVWQLSNSRLVFGTRHYSGGRNGVLVVHHRADLGTARTAKRSCRTQS